MLSPQFERFCTNWLSKADQYDEASIDECFDKFFTLYVVFNRLYAEATFELARRGAIQISGNLPFPDRKGATEYTLQIIGIDNFEQLYSSQLAPHVNNIIGLIDAERFYIKLSFPYGLRQREQDVALLRRLRSSGKKRAIAILDLIYSIRCNLFHGHKEFQEAQSQLLMPAIYILSSVLNLLHRTLRAI